MDKLEEQIYRFLSNYLFTREGVPKFLKRPEFTLEDIASFFGGKKHGGQSYLAHKYAEAMKKLKLVEEVGYGTYTLSKKGDKLARKWKKNKRPPCPAV